VPYLNGMVCFKSISSLVRNRYNRYLVVAVILLIIVLLFIPFETTVVPMWRLRVVDVNGNACSGMAVHSSWQHYSLELEPMAHRDMRLTNPDGYVEFPRRPITASLGIRIVNTTFAYLTLIAHGSVGPDGAVWATGLEDVAWLKYEPGERLPDKMVVEKCLVGAGR